MQPRAKFCQVRTSAGKTVFHQSLWQVTSLRLAALLSQKNLQGHLLVSDTVLKLDDQGSASDLWTCH